MNDSVINTVRFIKFAFLSSAKDFQNCTGNKKNIKMKITHTFVIYTYEQERERRRRGRE